MKSMVNVCGGRFSGGRKCPTQIQSPEYYIDLIKCTVTETWSGSTRQITKIHVRILSLNLEQ
jgi:hypothetical protein